MGAELCTQPVLIQVPSPSSPLSHNNKYNNKCHDFPAYITLWPVGLMKQWIGSEFLHLQQLEMVIVPITVCKLCGITQMSAQNGSWCLVSIDNYQLFLFHSVSFMKGNRKLENAILQIAEVSEIITRIWKIFLEFSRNHLEFLDFPYHQARSALGNDRKQSN